MPVRNQESLAPTNKVTAAGLGGAVTTLVIFVAAQLGVEISAEAAGSLATLVGVLLAYVVRDRIDA